LTVDNVAEVKQYLLGTLTDEEKARLEEKYFTDDELFEQIEIVEDELVDAYIRGELKRDEAAQFEKNLGASERLAERVAFAQTLAISTQKQAPARSTPDIRVPFWRRLFFPPTPQSSLRWATVAGLVILAGGLLVFQLIRIRQELQRLHGERAQIEQRYQTDADELSRRNAELNAQLAEARSENERLSNEIENARRTPESDGLRSLPAAFFLSPGALRSSGKTSVVVVSSQRPTVRLDLGLDAADYSSYQATIRTIEGKDVFTKGDLPARTRGAGKVVQFTVPTARLTDGLYSVELSGRSSSEPLQRVSTYPFRVEHK